MPVTAERPYSTDRNLFHISYEGGILEDPWAEPPAKMFLLTNSPEAAPDVPVPLEIDFEARRRRSRWTDKRLGPVALLERLNRVGGEHGIGRVDLVENRFVGMKSRGVYETPGGTILHVARRALESLTLDREVLHLRDSLVPRYAEMIYYGFWFSPERQALQGFMDECQRDVTGTVRLKLYKGNVTVAGRRSPRSLYRDRLRHLRSRQRLPPARRRRLHQPERAASANPRPARPRLTGADRPVRVDVVLTAEASAADGGGRSYRPRDRRPAGQHHDHHRARPRLPGARARGRSGRGAAARPPLRRRRAPARRRAPRRDDPGFDLGNSPVEVAEASHAGPDGTAHHQQRDAGAAGRARPRRPSGWPRLINRTAAAAWAGDAGPRRRAGLRGGARDRVAGRSGLCRVARRALGRHHADRGSLTRRPQVAAAVAAAPTRAEVGRLREDSPLGAPSDPLGAAGRRRRLPHSRHAPPSSPSIVPTLTRSSPAEDNERAQARTGDGSAGVNLPIGLTMTRIVAVPLLIVFLISSSRVDALIAAAIFILASITDWLDGVIARRRNQVTTLGTLLDPIADKLLVAAALVSLLQIDKIAAWIVVVIIGRELAVTGLRAVAAGVGVIVPASRLAKWKTVSQYVAITMLILEKGIGAAPFHAAAMAVLWVALGLTVVSAVDYFYRFFRKADYRAIVPEEERWS